MTNASRGRKSAGIFGAFYILAFFSIWAGLVGTFDYLVLHGMQRQGYLREKTARSDGRPLSTQFCAPDAHTEKREG